MAAAGGFVLKLEGMRNYTDPIGNLVEYIIEGKDARTIGDRIFKLNYNAFEKSFKSTSERYTLEFDTEVNTDAGYTITKLTITFLGEVNIARKNKNNYVSPHNPVIMIEYYDTDNEEDKEIRVKFINFDASYISNLERMLEDAFNNTQTQLNNAQEGGKRRSTRRRRSTKKKASKKRKQTRRRA